MVYHRYELGRREEDLSNMIPTEDFQRGIRLRWLPPPPFDPAPFVLIDNDGLELYRWDYVPNMGEVLDKLNELSK